VERIQPPEVTKPLEPLLGISKEILRNIGRGGMARRLPLGTLAGARSGDKGGNANIGLWVRDPDAYGWLCDVVSESGLRALLPEAAALTIRIAYLPNILAVNAVIEGLLGEGVAYNARFDPQAKGLGEWLRSRHVDIPIALLGER
jgi:hypothetical protein